jgi:hypothetical protein
MRIEFSSVQLLARIADTGFTIRGHTDLKNHKMGNIFKGVANTLLPAKKVILYLFWDLTRDLLALLAWDLLALLPGHLLGHLLALLTGHLVALLLGLLLRHLHEQRVIINFRIQ